MTSSANRRALAGLLILFAVSRALLLGAGLHGARTLGSGRAAQPGNVQRPWYGPQALEIWARWDAEWYLLIAERGYHLEERMAGKRVAYRPADATGFFPLYPLLIRALGEALALIPGTGSMPTEIHSGEPPTAPGGTPYLLAALLISNGALLGAVLLLYRRVLDTGHADGAAGPGGALVSAAALLFYPPSLFLSAAYAESLLLFLGLLCFSQLRSGRWWGASLAGALASATKPSGLLLMNPAAVALAASARRAGAGSAGHDRARWLTLLVYPCGTAAFSLYCRLAFGDPLSWAQRQMRWRGEASGPWRAFVRWSEDPRLHGAHGSTVELIFAVLAVVLLVYCVRRRPAAETIFAGLVILPPLCSTLWSFGRLSLQAFPLFIVLGGWLAGRPARAVAWLVVSAGGMAALAAFYAAWWWAG